MLGLYVRKRRGIGPKLNEGHEGERSMRGESSAVGGNCN